jgi:hypothetical protein
MVHVSETCEPTAPHLLTHIHTTAATVHEARGRRVQTSHLLISINIVLSTR